MKILYYSLNYINYKNKIDGQINEMIRRGNEVYLFLYNGDHSFSLIKIDSKKTVMFFPDRGKLSSCSLLKKVIISERFDLVYIRRPGVYSLGLRSVLRRLKKNCANVIYEIPTYPVERNGSFLMNILYYIEEQYFRRGIYKYCDVVPVYCYISGMRLEDKMVSVENCVSTDAFKDMADIPFPDYDGSEIRLLGIAHYKNWHAYDRMINAIRDWDKRPNITFTIYGNPTSERQKLTALVERLGLEDKISFIEEKDVSDYEQFISGYHIGVGCLGIHRKMKNGNNSLLDTSIKNKEYCAMGLPFIHSTKDVSFPDDFKYHYLTENSDAPLSLEPMIEWYNKIRSEIISRDAMISFADNNLGYDKYIEKIFSHL